MPNQADPTAGLTEVVLLVHGTFAYDDQDEAIATSRRWWQRASAFCRRFTEVLRELDPSRILEFQPFRWSGANRESNRRNTARLLLKSLLKLESEGRSYHVVAHSHGGSALWEALCLALPRKRTTEIPFPNLKTWTTIGTPFLLFVPDLIGLLAVLPLCGLMILCLLLSHQHLWCRDFWTEFATDVEGPWYLKAATAQLTYLGVLLLPALLLHILFRVFSLWRAQHDARYLSDSPKYELLRLIYSAAWTALWVLILCASAWLFNSFMATLPVARSAVNSIPAILVSLHTWTGLIVVVTCIWLIGTTVFQIVNCMLRRRRSQIAWAAFGQRYRCVSSLQYDEATRALAAITNGIKGPLLPRLTAPGAGKYSAGAGRLTVPETPTEPWFHQIVMPILIARDWLEPVSKRTFAS